MKLALLHVQSVQPGLLPLLGRAPARDFRSCRIALARRSKKTVMQKDVPNLCAIVESGVFGFAAS